MLKTLLPRLMPRLRSVALAALVGLCAGPALATYVVDSSNGLVTDTDSGLMWDQCALGFSGAACSTGTAATYSWADAFTAAASKNSATYKGYNDWRLPSITELKTLVRGAVSPFIDTATFLNMDVDVNNPFLLMSWSATTTVEPDEALLLHFGSGSAFLGYQPNPNRVRLVRGGQYTGTFPLLPGGVSGIALTTATLTVTSPVVYNNPLITDGPPIVTTAHWRVVRRGSPLPTPAQVIDGGGYSGISITSGSSSLTVTTPIQIAINNLYPGTAYDLYLVAGENTFGTRSLVGPIPFSTTAIIATRSIAIDPVTPATLYAGLDGAGIYKSTNSGDNWTAATVPADKKNVRALVLKPGDSSKLFAASYGGGMLQSSDSGLTWTACSGQPGNLNLVTLAIDANGKLYAGSEGGVFSSANDCASWADVSNGLPK